MGAQPGLSMILHCVRPAAMGRERSAFDDSDGAPRLLLRARFRERIAGTVATWADLAG